MVRSFFRLAIRDHFFGPLGCLLESFWGVFGLVLGHLGLFWARFWALRVAFWNTLALYAHQLINASSTLQPVARQHFETRAGGLRAERLNPPPPEGSERVQIVFEIFFEFLFEFFELKESSQGPRSPPQSSDLLHSISWAPQIGSKFVPKSIQKSLLNLMSFWSRC